MRCGLVDVRYLLAAGVFEKLPSCCFSSPNVTQLSNKIRIEAGWHSKRAARESDVALAACSASKTPSCTAANITFERRKASIKSKTTSGESLGKSLGKSLDGGSFEDGTGEFEVIG